jgi:hypothetical protein
MAFRQTAAAVLAKYQFVCERNVLHDKKLMEGEKDADEEKFGSLVGACRPGGRLRKDGLRSRRRTDFTRSGPNRGEERNGGGHGSQYAPA